MTTIPSSTSLSGAGGSSSVLGNFARVSAALQDGEEEDRKESDDEDGPTSRDDYGDHSPEKYEVDDVVLTAEQTRQRNLAHFAEF